MRRLSYAVPLLVAVLLTGCSQDTTAGPDPSPSAPETSDTGSPTTSDSPSSTPPSTSAPTKPTEAPSGGTPADPRPVQPDTDLLDWQDVPGPMSTLVTVGDGVTLSVPTDRSKAVLTGDVTTTVRAGDHSSISDTALGDDVALVVSEDRLARQRDTATLVDLTSGKPFTLDSSSELPPAVGGTWALGAGHALYTTTGAHHSYCLARFELESGASSKGWCAPRHQGFSHASASPEGDAMTTFDDHRPSCRTLVTVSGTETTRLEGTKGCDGWEVALLQDGAIWTVVPNAHQIDRAHVYARTPDGYYDLGPGTSGSVTVCGGAAYFVRDPARKTDHADLLRWTPDGRLSVVFESKGTGKAFLAPPRCGSDSHLTLSAYAAAGDQQVTAPVG